MVKISAFLVLVGFLVQIEYVVSQMSGGKIMNAEFICPITQVVDEVVTKFCTGTLVNHKFVLTSALCIEGGTLDNTLVQCSSLPYYAGRAKKRRIANITVHPDFDIHTGKNAIALIKLLDIVTYKTPITFTTIPAACGAEVTASGWNGNLARRLSHYLGSLDLEVLNMTECKEKFPEINKFGDLDNIICTYGGQGKDMCEMDLGTPLTKFQSHVLFGVYIDVLSLVRKQDHDNDCDKQYDHPLFFTNVIPYRPWIDKIIRS